MNHESSFHETWQKRLAQNINLTFYFLLLFHMICSCSFYFLSFIIYLPSFLWAGDSNRRNFQDLINSLAPLGHSIIINRLTNSLTFCITFSRQASQTRHCSRTCVSVWLAWWPSLWWFWPCGQQVSPGWHKTIAFRTCSIMCAIMVSYSVLLWLASREDCTEWVRNKGM